MNLAQPLERVNQELYFSAITESIRAWARTAPEEALIWLQKNGNSGLCQDLGSSGALGEESEILPLIVSRLDDGVIREELVNSTIYSWLAKDESAAVAYINDLPQDLSLDRTSLQMFDKVKDKDHEQALVWANFIADPLLKESILQELSESKHEGCKHCEALLERR